LLRKKEFSGEPPTERIPYTETNELLRTVLQQLIIKTRKIVRTLPLQNLSSDVSPAHPLSPGSPLRHERFRVWIPPPQVTEHSV